VVKRQLPIGTPKGTPIDVIQDQENITSLPSLKGSFGGVDGIDNWHAKGPTINLYQERKKR
jgi:hypothetical protein